MTHHYSKDTKTVYTIGHSNHNLGHFLNLLGTHEIDVVADTRSSPRSRFVPHFNRDALQQALEARNISRKHSECCIAGLRLDGGGWIRPVAPTHDGR